MSEPFVSNVISQKYDTALDFHVTMYDKLPYERDSDYCNIEKIAIVSGRVLKFYLYYYNQPEIFTIDNQDDKLDEIFAKAKAASAKKRPSRVASAISSADEADVTPEQIQTLLDDREDISLTEDDFDEENIDNIVTYDTKLDRTLGIDSINLLKLTLGIEEDLGINLDDYLNLIHSARTVRELVSIIEKATKK